MQVARRVYVYLITLVSLLMTLAGAANLLRLLVAIITGTPPDVYVPGGDYQRQQFSLWGAMLIVGGVVWAIHWGFAQRAVAAANPDAPDERQSALRELFLYAVLGVTLVYVALGAGDLLYTLIRAMPTPSTPGWGAQPGGDAAQVLVYGLAWLYYRRVCTRDVAATPEGPRGATVRRWYLYGVIYVALTGSLNAASGLAGTLWALLTAGSAPTYLDGQWVPAPIAGPLTGILVAGGIWLAHWRAAQRRVAADPEEQRSTLRKVYLYAMTLQTVAVTLANLAVFLYNLLRLVWGTNPVAGRDQTVLEAAGGPLLTALVYGTFWAYHRRVLGADSRLPVAGPAVTATLRRLYHYMVALIGLALLGGGVADLLRLLIDGGLGGRDTVTLSAQGWGDALSLAVTLVLAGMPVWVWSWQAMQREALGPAGPAARQALPRRLYLFVVLFLTVSALLAGAAVLLYQVLRNLGTPAASWVSDMSWALATTITAGVLLAYHVTVLVRDGQARAAAGDGATPVPAPAATLVPATIVLLTGPSEASLAAALAALPATLPAGVAATPFAAAGLTATEVGAWLAGRAPAGGETGAPGPGAPEPALMHS